MVQWDMAAVVVAVISIPLMLSPYTLSTLKVTCRLMLQYLHPVSGRCERFEWSDVPEGVLTDCGAGCPKRPATPHDDCWNSTLGTTFPKAWTSATRREIWVKKPTQLDPFKKYIRTDVRTLKAYLLINQYHRTPWDPRNDEAINQDPTIRFLDVDGVLTAHLHNHPRTHHCGRTKLEIERILKGYPQQYQEFIMVASQASPVGASKTTYPSIPATTVLIPSPIQRSGDVFRGGWIVGVGLEVRSIKLSKLWYPPKSTIGHTMEVGS